MIAYRLSTLELRSIVEGAFLPLRCTCSVAPDSSMTVQITDPDSERVELFVTGISMERLNTTREISELVAELRYDLAHTRHLPGRQGSHRGVHGIN
ncbi:DUF1652 domain-containing protein [Pseudomonas caspiana]